MKKSDLEKLAGLRKLLNANEYIKFSYDKYCEESKGDSVIDMICFLGKANANLVQEWKNIALGNTPNTKDNILEAKLSFFLFLAIKTRVAEVALEQTERLQSMHDFILKHDMMGDYEDFFVLWKKNEA